MRIHGYALRNRRGIGSIIGGAFLLLIMLVGYLIYSFSIQAINNQQQVLSDMRTYDIERSQEAFILYDEPEWITGYLKVSIQNIGPRPANIICIGIWDKTRALAQWDYSLDEVQVWDEAKKTWDAFNPRESPVIIKSGYYKTFNAYIPGVSEETMDWTYKLQFLTDKGTIYEVWYPVRAP